MGVTDGITLARSYYQDVVAPLLRDRWPGLPHAGARLGSGSDVLGLDDETSRDHDWGLRLTLLVEGDQVRAVTDYLEERLPDTYRGLPTRFATSWDPAVRQRAEVATAEAFVASRLGLDASGTMTSLDWLCLTGQSLLEVTAGQVFTDDLGVLTGLRRKLAWYPDDVWCYVVAADWIRLGVDLPVLGRTGHRGDDLGSRVICARIVNTAMHLAFLLSRRWPPYPKWLGTMSTQLPMAGDLVPVLTAALTAQRWSERQEAVAQALAVLHRAQRGAGLATSEGIPTELLVDRPVLGIRAPVPDLLLQAVTDPLVRALPPGVGSVEQWVDNVRVLMNADHRVQTARSYLMARAQPIG
ncbi:DUF4037 domain-containing protein [Kineosporia sp. NBRC 101677]|uniref:DUF4037 domain-containing protein n=1 Tax=Kineosporia sp. NBRC 101677 TaxID=3032197 RepID=UPI003322643B